MPRGKKFETGKLNETLSALNSVTPKPKDSLNLKQLIKGLKPKIKRLRSWNYSWAEITELLGQQGITISEDTLKEYMKTPRRKNKKEKPATQETSSVGTNHLNNKNRVKDNGYQHEDDIHVNTLDEGDIDKLSEHDDKLTITESSSEVSNYQPIKLTMRK